MTVIVTFAADHDQICIGLVAQIIVPKVVNIAGRIAAILAEIVGRGQSVHPSPEPPFAIEIDVPVPIPPGFIPSHGTQPSGL